MTPDFKTELAHRVRVMNGHRLEALPGGAGLRDR